MEKLSNHELKKYSLLALLEEKNDEHVEAMSSLIEDKSFDYE